MNHRLLPRPLSEVRALAGRWVGAALTGLGLAIADGAQLLPNPQFESGADGPLGWRLVLGQGQWAPAGSGLRGGRALAVQGAGEDQASWHTEPLPLRPGALYGLRFFGRRQAGATGGTAVSGTSRINRDFPLGPEWGEQSFIFRQPDAATNDVVRLGQWHVKGSIAFAEADLWPVVAMHARTPDGLELGEAESVQRGVYRFRPDLNWRGANFHRPLIRQSAGFNSNRYLFQSGSELVFDHRIEKCVQTSARVHVGINYHEAGSLRIEASRDGQAWTPVGECDGSRRVREMDLPAALFPADRILVRLVSGSGDVSLQVDTYAYEAPLQGAAADASGETRFLEVLTDAGELAVDQFEWRSSETGTPDRLQWTVRNLGRRSLQLSGAWQQTGREPGPLGGTGRLQGGAIATLWGSLAGLGAGDHEIMITLRDDARPLFQGRLGIQVGFLEDASYGHPLQGRGDLALWWCESGWKVGRHRAPPVQAPRSRPEPIRVQAAGGEYEAVQLVVRPERRVTLRGLEPTELRDARGRKAAIELTVNEVAYVAVTQPTDRSCVRGLYPDPLPPVELKALQAGENHPFWLTFHVPPGTPAGLYRGSVRLWLRGGRPIPVPVEIEVFGFDLPRQTHLRSALGLGASSINLYHQLTNQQDQVAVYERYLENFAAHRISPYSFYDYAPLGVRFEGEGDAKRARLDFTRFDAAAARWLGEGHFNTFQLPLQGMGGGTFHSRYLGTLEGFQEGTPEFARLFRDYLGQVEAHLREKGWLAQAFTYWFDEPDPKDYAFVIAGMQRLKDAAPGIKRMLTEQPEKELSGHVDIWCGLTPEWTPESVRARRAAGEEVWWYICTGPKAPYVTEFIDHPGTELRLWPWQSWQYGVSGILVWATLYWTSPCAYAEPGLQDPWEDPMSWVSGYDTPVGVRSPWGNGDGRFLYPPRRDAGAALAANLDAPINSIRWENLRDGMEDYEYLWLLEQEIQRVTARGMDQADEARLARSLLSVPADVSQDLTHFTKDPRPILARREQIARSILQLRDRVPSKP